ncbi:MAG TPA: universal stress protein [Microbacterium sp.]|nr:universal stress protein [Microbacterium sp.]
MSLEPQERTRDHKVFGRVLCGVDGSPAGEEAVRQGARLRWPHAPLLLVSVATPAAAAHPEAAVALELHAATALRDAERDAGNDCEPHLLIGDPADCLLAAARDHWATLIAVGSHGSGRLGGLLAGSVATAMLHRASCSVLIARPPRNPDHFPARITVGVDGSDVSGIALELARELGTRLNATVTAVIARGATTDPQVSSDEVDAVHIDERDPVDALLDAAGRSDLLVLGARGLHGLRALGSVSERVAHRAPISVLVVRPTDTARHSD